MLGRRVPMGLLLLAAVLGCAAGDPAATATAGAHEKKRHHSARRAGQLRAAGSAVAGARSQESPSVANATAARAAKPVSKAAAPSAAGQKAAPPAVGQRAPVAAASVQQLVARMDAAEAQGKEEAQEAIASERGRAEAKGAGEAREAIASESESERRGGFERQQRGSLLVNGPLPPDFPQRFSLAVAAATGGDPEDVRVLASMRENKPGSALDNLVFAAPGSVVTDVEAQAADPESKLASGPLRIFLVERGEAQKEGRSPRKLERAGGEDAQDEDGEGAEGEDAHGEGSEDDEGAHRDESDRSEDDAPARDGGIDVDVEMPYGDLEAFGREDTARELTEASIRESDAMVDQLERAQIAEEKRAVFRALTRLRGAAITSFDGVARAQTGSIDEFGKRFRWRQGHSLHHLADEESDVKRWAFPEGEDC